MKNYSEDKLALVTITRNTHTQKKPVPTGPRLVHL